jgi:hypothetical protein
MRVAGWGRCGGQAQEGPPPACLQIILAFAAIVNQNGQPE